MMSKQTVQKLLEILAVALTGALIAFLQALLTGLAGLGLPDAPPETAAAAGAGLKALLSFRAHA